MKPEVIEITPELAKYWLTFNTGNRTLPTGNVKNYKRLIEAGEFGLSHQGVAFTGDHGNPQRLLDGQTRLHAIVSTGMSIKQWVFWNCPENTFAMIDGGKSRNFTDHYGWGKNKVSFCSTLLRFAKTQASKLIMTEAEKIWASFGWTFEMLMDRCPTSKSKITGAATRAGACLAIHQNPEFSEIITEQYRYMTLETCHKMKPSVGKVYSKLMNIEGGGGSVQDFQFGITHKALTPKNFNLKKLYEPNEQSKKEVADYIFNVCGL